jgi:hypothetical protein
MLYRGTKLVISGILLAGVGALIFSALSQPAHNIAEPSAYGSFILPASADAILSQCGNTFLFESEGKWTGTIPSDYTEETPKHPMVVPVYGYMSEVPFNEAKADSGTSTENVYTYPEILRGLWEGNHVIWVSPEYTQEGYDYLKNFASEWNQVHEDKVIIAAWDFDYQLPGGRDIAFSEWNASQTCETFSEATYEDFQTTMNNNSAPRDRQNPPKAVLTDGLLPLITPRV